MKGLLIICLLAGSPGIAPAGELLPFKGDPVPPPLTLPDLQGKPHQLAEYRGQVVLINFWATWCPPCVHEMPSMQHLKSRLAGKPFTMLGVNIGETRETINSFLGKVEVDFTILMDQDGEALAAWRVHVFPTSFIVDAKGKIRYAVVGGIDWDAVEVVEKIKDLL